MEDFKVYDYKTINIKRGLKYRIFDAISAFGYQIVETKELPTNILITIKREANIKNKNELDNKFDLVLKKIDDANKKNINKNNKPMIFGLSFGLIGLLIFGGGMSLIMEGPNKAITYVLGTILGIIGILIMIINEPIYKSMYQKNMTKIMPKIEELNNEINELLKEGNELLKNSLE